MTERQYLIALYSFPDFGSARTTLLVSYFGNAKNVWKASQKALRNVGLNPKIVNSFDSHRKDFDADKYFSELKKRKIDFVTVNDDEYPENLVGLEGAPQVLYFRGKLKQSDVNAVAIVGTRKVSSYGREIAKMFATELSGMGVTIVSGLAFGVDAVAHEATVAVEGRAIAVLASGLDQITPASNINLARRIIKSGGAIVSESPLGAQVWRSSFPIRNRIISGLSKAVIVVEGTRKSGTLLTASSAAEQGRTVFAVPGQITSPLSGASHFLLKRGAKIATCTQDILDELNLQLSVDKEEVERVMPSDAIEKKILQVLENEELHLDEIARLSEIRSSDVSGKLVIMELKGVVKNLGGGIYRRK